MRIKSTIRTIKTVCGKTITFLQEGDRSKMHSMEGPAIIYPESENRAPEYYLFGVRYSKAKWKELISQSKAIPADSFILPD